MPRRRRLNIPLIKGVVMFLLGGGVAVGSAITGIGAQVAAAPMIHFLLGYSPEKSMGTALAFALFTAGAAAIGIWQGGVRLDFTLALLLTIGATIGTMLVARPAADPRKANLRRAGQSLAILLSLYVIGEVFRQRVGGPTPVPITFFRDYPATGALILGTLAGALSHLLHIANGVLLVPALIYFLHRPVAEAMGTSLIVITLASILPAVSYSSRELVDRRMGPWMAGGGMIGGLAGGFWLARMAESGSLLPLIAFGFVAMFLSAWMLWKMYEPPPRTQV